MNVDQPVYQDCTHVFIYLWLSLHVAMIGLGFPFYILHIKLDLCTVLTNVIHVV